VALRLGIRLVRWWCRRFARLLAAFSVALLFFFRLNAALFLRGQFGLGLQRCHRLLDLRQPFLLVAGPVRHLVTTLVFAEGLVLLGIRRLGGRQHASDLRFQFRLAFLHSFITHRFMFRCVRFDLRASNATWPSLTSPAVSHNFRACRNNSPSAFKWRLRKPLIVRKSGGSSATIITNRSA